MQLRTTIITAVKRLAIGLFAAQLAAMLGLIGIDFWRKRVRPRKANFPRTAPKELPVGDSAVTTYTYGEDLFGAMLEAIRGAEHRILFESYIIKGDKTGREFKRELVAAAERGVDVHVVYDGFANLVVPRSFFRFPPTVNVLRFPMVHYGVLLLDLRKLGRDHRKILSVDGTTGFVGGYNVGRSYATEWRDTHLRLSGPAVWELENAFCEFWNRHRRAGQPRITPIGETQWSPDIRAQRNAPDQLVYPIRGMYLDAIDRAREHVYITQAYFIPDREFVDALVAAAHRGVDVRILVPAESNHIIADWMSRGLYSTLLRGGVTIWRFRNAMVHAKTATIDGRWSTIGTANVDRLSLTGNYEINVEIFDDGVAAHLEDVFANDSTNASSLNEAEWHARPFLAKLTERVIGPLRPLF